MPSRTADTDGFFGVEPVFEIKVFVEKIRGDLDQRGTEHHDDRQKGMENAFRIDGKADAENGGNDTCRQCVRTRELPIIIK